MRIGAVEIGPGHPCRLIAELGNAHGGSLDRMKRLMTAMKTAGADILKAQCYTAEELVELRGDGPAPEPWGSQGYGMLELYRKAATPLDWFPELVQHAESLDIPFFASVFGLTSINVAVTCGLPALKVSHLDAHSETLAQAVLETGKPILISIGSQSLISSAWYTSALTERLRSPVQTLWCPGGYPARLDEMQLSRVAEYFGMSSHCKHWFVAPMAVQAGAHCLEIHVELRAEPSELEHDLSFNEREVTVLKRHIREAECLYGA